jgi:hypothetical protein
MKRGAGSHSTVCPDNSGGFDRLAHPTSTPSGRLCWWVIRSIGVSEAVNAWYGVAAAWPVAPVSLIDLGQLNRLNRQSYTMSSAGKRSGLGVASPFGLIVIG